MVKHKQSAWKLMAGVVVGAAVVLGTAGCSSKPSEGHVEAVNGANQRWRQTRSTLILQMAQRSFNAGDLDEAEKTLVEAVNIDPENPELHLLAGRVALERSQLERAYGRLEKALEYDDKLAPAYYFQGIVLQRWKRYDQAQERYRQAYDLRADSLPYLLAVAEMHVAMDQPEAALELLEDKVNYFDQSAAIRGAVGQLYTVLGQPRKALEYTRQAALLEPDNLQLQEELAFARLRADDVAGAIRDLQRLTAMPELAQRDDLQRVLARAYRRTDRLAEAKKIYLTLTRRDDRNPELWIALGEVSWAQSDTAGALLAGSRAMATAPSRPEGYLLAGLVWQRRGEMDKALRLFDRAASLDPQATDPVILRGLALQQAGRTTAAAAAYRSALKRNPQDTRARQLLASLSQSQRHEAVR